jgi:acid stress-induced BolA-like protein IbaG/YrbA
MVHAEDICKLIEAGLPQARVAVSGEDGRHFEAVVISPAFAGKTLVQQHQMVYRVLGERMREEIHALSLKTYTPEAAETAGLRA